MENFCTHRAAWATCSIVSLFLLRIMWTMASHCQGSRFHANMRCVGMRLALGLGRSRRDDIMVGAWFILEL